MKKALRLNYKIKPDLKNLMQQLIALDNEAQQLDRILKNVRVKIHDMFWCLVGIKSKEDF